MMECCAICESDPLSKESHIKVHNVHNKVGYNTVDSQVYHVIKCCPCINVQCNLMKASAQL